MTSIGSAFTPVIPAIDVAFEERAERRGATRRWGWQGALAETRPSPHLISLSDLFVLAGATTVDVAHVEGALLEEHVVDILDRARRLLLALAESSHGAQQSMPLGDVGSIV